VFNIITDVFQERLRLLYFGYDILNTYIFLATKTIILLIISIWWFDPHSKNPAYSR